MTGTSRALRYELDPSVRRVGGGRVLIGGSPLKLFRLTDAGAQLIDRVSRGHAIDAPETAGRLLTDLIDRLVDAGVIHPVPASDGPGPDVTVVIPAFDTTGDVLEALVAQCGEAKHVIIVDDASATPIHSVRAATVLRHEINQGAGAARGTGAALAATPLVAFVDTDVVLDRGWLAPLVAHFADDRVALVAPRVVSVPGSSLLDRYEALRSPLDLGSQPARVRAGSRVGYVPSAAVVVRLDALRAVGGFDESLRVGEDVDLVWRLDEAGYGLRYEPASTVHHRPRRTVAGWIRQRFDYGSSAAPLARRHPAALAPVRVSGWSAAAWIATVAGSPIAGGSIAAVTTALLARKLRDVPDGPREAIRLAGLGHLYAGRSLAGALTRSWWPASALVAVFSRRARRVLLLAALAPATIDWLRTKPPINPLAYVGLRVLDDLAYGAGVAKGVISERSLDAVRPDFTSWPAQKPTPKPKPNWRLQPTANANPQRPANAG